MPSIGLKYVASANFVFTPLVMVCTQVRASWTAAGRPPSEGSSIWIQGAPAAAKACASS